MKLFRILLVSLVLPISAHADSLWTTDFEAARETAKQENKPLLVNFTGSDWCGWCIRLKKEVFDTNPFQAAAPELFVLVEIDFPRDESSLPEETRAQNQALLEKYGVQGFPTILLLDDEGEAFAKTGYREGGADAFLEHLKELLANR